MYFCRKNRLQSLHTCFSVAKAEENNDDTYICDEIHNCFRTTYVRQQFNIINI